MIKVKEVIIVEGRYDKIKLSSIIDGVIIETNGFGIFKDKHKQRYIKKMAEKNGIIILTDSDSAGFIIRAKISSFVEPRLIKHAYIPDILGKEKRKDLPSKEGKLGVEGIDSEIIIKAIESAGYIEDRAKTDRITKLDFYQLGLSGRDNSSDKRNKLLKKLDLPEQMPVNSLIRAVNALYSREEFIDYVNGVADE